MTGLVMVAEKDGELVIRLAKPVVMDCPKDATELEPVEGEDGVSVAHVDVVLP